MPGRTGTSNRSRTGGTVAGMRLNPRYEGPPVLVFDPAVDPSVPLFRQRRRMADTLATFDDAQWAAPSRCVGWSSRDVISHLITTNAFWAASIAAGRAGQPTQFLPGFDPAVTPAQLVAASPVIGTDELLARFIATNAGPRTGARRTGRRRVDPVGRGARRSSGPVDGGQPRPVGRLDPRAGHRPAPRPARGRGGRRGGHQPPLRGRPGPVLSGHRRLDPHRVLRPRPPPIRIPRSWSRWARRSWCATPTRARDCRRSRAMPWP